MKPTALLLAAALCALPARAEPIVKRERGSLTGVGFGLLIGSLGSLGLGVAGTFSANLAAERLEVYGTQAVSAADRPAVDTLRARQESNTILAGLGFGLSVAFLAAGIICLAVDAPPPPVSVAFVPTAQGGQFAFSARF